MFRTHLKIALRNFVKDRFFSAINIVGLAVGISVVLLIVLYISHETSYDRFHSKAERIYRIAMHLEMGGSVADLNATFPPMAKAVNEEVPEVEQAVRLSIFDERAFKYEDKVFSEDNILFADKNLFDVFDIPVIAGDASTALQNRNQIMLTRPLAKKYFNSENGADVLGKSVQINGESYQVTGIVEEAPGNSHFHYKAICSLESTEQGRDETWNSMNMSTYLLLAPGANIETVTNKIVGVIGRHMNGYDSMAAKGFLMQPFAQPLTDIHLHSNIQGEFGPTGNIQTLYILGTVAGIVLLLACVNFVNLVTARSANRAKEVGVRKVLGSAAHQLMRQFTLESVAVVGVATLLALGIVELVRRPFNVLSGSDLPFDTLLQPAYLAALFLFVLVLGIAAGSYPAFFMSSFNPAQVLKGKVRAGFRSGGLKNVLVTIQFIISIALITCTLIVHDQLSFMRSKKLGFDKENVVILDNVDKLQSLPSFVTSIKSIGQVQGVGAADSRPVGDFDGMPVITEDDRDNSRLINFMNVDEDFLPLLKYDIAEGRNFSRDLASDSMAVILNERAAEFLFGEKPLGKKLQPRGAPAFLQYTVIGVVKDFNFESLKNEVRPMLFFLQRDYRFLHVRLNPGDYSAALNEMQVIWKQQNPDVPFSYSFLDETYDNLFKEEVKLGNIFSIFTGLALFIACLGLVGLAAYMAEQRKKEISVRKVLGATVAHVVILMSRDFARLMVIAFILATPLAYYMMTRWLDSFAYKVNISPVVLLAGGAAVMVIALLAVSYQAIRAALVNPVDSLKEE
jgi:putative ABC transport system permease protein